MGATSWRQEGRLAALRGAIFASIAVLALFAPPEPADAARSETVNEAICRLIDGSAARYHLPAPFFTRLIWSESSFRAGAVSPAGAQGIAQFMPGTAAERGLANPFDPEQAIGKSAQLLADLNKQFGNLGLAAAAYNAGPKRVSLWLQKQGALPAETQAYVLRITGHRADEWAAELNAGKTSIDTGAKQPTPTTCLAVTASLRIGGGGGGLPALPPLSPWGVQLAGSFSKRAALAAFERSRNRYSRVIGDVRPMIIGTRLLSRGAAPFYRVRIPEPSRAAADAQCRRILSVGGNCVPLRT